MVSLPLCHIDGKRQEKEWYVPNPAIYIRTLVHIFIPFGLHSSRTLNPGRPMMIWSGNKIARRTAFIHRAAYLRHIFGVLWRYVSYTFRIRFDLLSVILLFGDFGRRRLKLQLYLSVECCKFGLQLFQFVLLLPYLPGYLLQLWDLLFLHLVLRLVLVNDGRNPLLCVQEIACGGYRVSHRQHAAYVIQGY